MINPKLKLIYIAIIFFGLFGLAESSLAVEYYVDQNHLSASDSNAGTSESLPWLTLGKAASTMVAGDTTYVKTGTYTPTYSGQWYIPDVNPMNSGTAGNPITFRVYTGNTVTITPSDQRKINTGSLVGAYNKSYIIWDGFILDTSSMTANHGGVMFHTADYGEARNLRVIGHYAATTDNDDLIRLESSDYAVVSNCLIYGQRGLSFNVSGIKNYYSTNLTIEHNEIYDCTTAIYDKDDGVNNIYRYNLIHDSDYGLYGPGNETNNTWDIYQNIFYNITNVAIYLNYNHIGTKIRNNTIYNCGSGIIGRENTGITGNNEIYNNVIHTVTTTIFKRLNLLSYCNYNDFYNYSNFNIDGASKTYVQWKSDTGFDSNSITSDPQFVDIVSHNFHLQGGSPCIGTGQGGINMGAYITGNEVIGYVASETPDTTPPAAPQGLSVQ